MPVKRSEINQVIKDMEILIDTCRFKLPPFAFWNEQDWKDKGAQYDEIRDNHLGWDITDFGLNDFKKVGFALFTIRNGNYNMKKYKKTYAEKLLMLYEGQNAALHYHSSKMEDIINRGGNDVYITVYNSDREGNRLETDVEINTDGRHRVVSAGSKIKLSPGESITIQQFMYHDFSVPKSGGNVLLGEVSMCNDDENDNFFDDKRVGRFPVIEEDEPKYRVLCNEYV